MIKKIVFLIIAIMALKSWAIDVENVAGGLSETVTDWNITSLKVTGTMNALDFYFLSDNLHQLTDIDIEGVKILPIYTSKPYYWRQDFHADVLPVCAFCSMNLERVVLPAGLKGIGKAAFANCKRLTSVTMPATLDSIADLAFAACESLQTVVLPAQVVYVGKGAFMRCTSLTSLVVERSSRLNSVDEAVLMDCPNLKSISLGPALQNLGQRALAGSGIQSLDLKSCRSLNTIGDWAFTMMPLTDVQLPASLTSLGEGAFINDSLLAEVRLGGSLTTLSDYLFAGTALNTKLDLTGVNELGDYALYNVSQLSSVTLPATMTRLGSFAMAGMTGLDSLNCEAVDVPALGDNVWAGVMQSQIPLVVPATSIELYKETPQWQDFLFESVWLKGDVNADGEISVADINMVIEIIKGRQYSDETMQRADVNGDGEITVADINMIIILIQNPSNRLASVVDTDDLLRLDGLTLQPGEQRTVDVTLDNAQAYSALQCDITLPQGLTLVSVSASRGYVGETCSHDALTTRAVTYSMNRKPFDSDCKPVLTFTVRADAAWSMEGEIVLSNVVLADADNVAWHAAGCHAPVTISTGIEDLADGADRIWTEGGTLMVNAHAAGTLQVTAMNGMTRIMNVNAGINRFELEAGFYIVSLNGINRKIAVK